MKFKEQIVKVAQEIEKLGYMVELPIECMKGYPKNIASRTHMDRIANEKTDAILVVNMDKPNMENYIGPNSFAEIAFAFYYHKKIFLLNDIYEPYKDELLGWNAIPLKGKLESLKAIL